MGVAADGKWSVGVATDGKWSVGVATDGKWSVGVATDGKWSRQAVNVAPRMIKFKIPVLSGRCVCEVTVCVDT